jgi:uncharacterized membrane protein
LVAILQKVNEISSSLESIPEKVSEKLSPLITIAITLIIQLDVAILTDVVAGLNVFYERFVAFQVGLDSRLENILDTLLIFLGDLEVRFEAQLRGIETNIRNLTVNIDVSLGRFSNQIITNVTGNIRATLTELQASLNLGFTNINTRLDGLNLSIGGVLEAVLAVSALVATLFEYVSNFAFTVLFTLGGLNIALGGLASLAG